MTKTSLQICQHLDKINSIALHNAWCSTPCGSTSYRIEWLEQKCMHREANCEEVQGHNCSTTLWPPGADKPSLTQTDSGMRTRGWELKAMPNRKTTQEPNKVTWGEGEVKEMQQRISEGVNPEEEFKRLTRFLYCWEYISKSWLKKKRKYRNERYKQTYTWQTNKQKIYKRSC